jgi:uncharacterized protein YjbI with pentapeptide repeats
MNAKRAGMVTSLPLPTTDDRVAWGAYWQALGQPWRTEPTIAPERQTELAERRKLRPKVAGRRFPFAGMRLSRADVEWLLATHQGGRKSIDPEDHSQRNRHGVDLRRADVAGVDLSGLPLIHLWGGSATMSSLASRGADAARMRGTVLVGADLRGATLCWVDLTGANLTNATLQHADLRWANFTNARLVRVRLEETFPYFATWRGANLTGASLGLSGLSFGDLEEANLTRIHGAQARFEQTRLCRATLCAANLRQARFRHANLDGADLTGADLSYARLEEVSLDGTCLRQVTLIGTFMTRAVARSFQEADLSQVHLIED